jgi:hypothetical protein
MEKILTVYSPDSGNVSPCHVIDWKSTSAADRVEEVVRIVLGTFVFSGRPKKEGRGVERVVVKYVTCRWT